MALPETVYIDGVYKVPPIITSAYIPILDRYGLTQTAKERPEIAIGSIGGSTQEETYSHFATQFLNSCVRIGRIVVDQSGVFIRQRKRIQQVFSTGKVSILDLPCGTGAGTIGLVSYLVELRRSDQIPKTPLDIFILGADYSNSALVLYKEMWNEVAIRARHVGIDVTYSTITCDLSAGHQVSKLIDQWIGASGIQNDWFILISNFSGVLKHKVQRDKFERSFSTMTDRLASRPFTLLWVEPKFSAIPDISRWFRRIYSSIKEFVSISSEQGASDEYYFSCPASGRDRVRSGVEVLECMTNV